MASVEVAIERLEIGDVPAISVKTGKPCTNPVGVKFRYARAVLPIEPSRARLHRTFVYLGWPLLVVELVGLFVLPLITFVGIMAYVVLFAIDQALWVGAKPGSQKGTLLLTRVHPAFAEAVNR